MPKSVIDLMRPLMRSPRAWLAANSSHGFGRHCLMPSEMRRRSSSMSSTMTSHGVAHRDDFRRMHVLVGPVHLGNVNQPFDALLDLGKAAVGR